MTDYKPMTMLELAKELNCPLTQRGRPDIRNFLPSRFVSLEEAKARGMSRYWIGEACPMGHQASRSVANPHDCADCTRIKEGREPIFPKSKAQSFRNVTKLPKAVTDAAGPAVVIAPPAPPEPSKKDQDFLAQLDTLRDFDAAAKACGMTRGLIEARASSNPVFRSALSDLCERRGIAWTRTPDPESFNWTSEIERALCRRYVDVGLLEQARQELGISASQFHAHLASSPEFAAAVMASETTARSTLRERAMAAAAVGNDRLAKLLEEDQENLFVGPDGRRVSYINPEQMRAEMAAMLAEIKKMLDKKEGLRDVIRANAKRAAGPTPATDEDLT